VTPHRSTRSGRAVAARALLALIAVVVAVGGCIGTQEAGPTTTPSLSFASSSPSGSIASPTLQPSPSASPTDVPTESPAASASPTGTPSSLPVGEAVTACSGSDDNRTFFLDAAQNLDWPVYCAVLPARWFVSNGTYSGRGVGQLVISYNGPSGATLELQQGGFCETSDGCVPAGTDAGETAFGDQSGTLVTLDDGGYAIVVGRASTPSWLAVGVGIDEADFRDLAASFVRLD
jgi:hypothetical protein